MVKELIIHLGDCKTGSTAIQTCLSGGGFSLPDGALTYPSRFNHNPLAQSLSDLSDTADQTRYLGARFKAIAAALARSDAEWGILSAELFEYVSPQRLQEALASYLPEYAGRTRLIAYVRPHTNRVVSGYAERVKKTGGPARMGAYVDAQISAGRLSYFERFSAWRDTFGDAYTLRPFVPDRLVARDVVSDFLAFVCGSDAVEVHETPRRNSSLSLRNLVMCRIAHAQLGQHPELTGPLLTQVRRQLGWHMAPYLSEHEPEGAERLYLPRNLAVKMRDACREDAAAMDAAFFDGHPLTTALDAAPEKAPKTAQSLKPDDHFDPATQGMICGWADMIAHLAVSDPAHFSWAVRPEAERAALSMGKDGTVGGGLDPFPAPQRSKGKALLKRLRRT